MPASAGFGEGHDTGPAGSSPTRCYDFDKYRSLIRARGIMPIARRGSLHGSGLGKTRWVVEHTFVWQHQFKRLRIRYEIRADLHLALPQLVCSVT